MSKRQPGNDQVETNIKPFYMRPFQAMNDFARKHPFLTGFLIAGLITAAVFTGGAALLIPAAMFSTIAYAPFIVSGFLAVLGVAVAMGGDTATQKGGGLLATIGFGATAFACQMFPPFGVAMVGVLLSTSAGLAGGAVFARVYKKKDEASILVKEEGIEEQEGCGYEYGQSEEPALPLKSILKKDLDIQTKNNTPIKKQVRFFSSEEKSSEPENAVDKENLKFNARF